MQWANSLTTHMMVGEPDTCHTYRNNSCGGVESELLPRNHFTDMKTYNGELAILLCMRAHTRSNP